MLDEWRILACNLIVTKGSTGAALYVGDSTEPLSIPSFADQVEGVGVDTTGAGDVFAAAMLIRLCGYRGCRGFGSVRVLVCRAIHMRPKLERGGSTIPLFIKEGLTTTRPDGTEGSDQWSAGTHTPRRVCPNVQHLLQSRKSLADTCR